MLAPQDAIMHGTRYNVPLLNALAFYVGIQVGSTRPAPAAQVPVMWQPAKWAKLAMATLRVQHNI